MPGAAPGHSTTGRLIALGCSRSSASALALLREQPSAIKRPVVEWPGAAPGITVGFDAEHWTQRLRDLGESPSN